MTNDGNNTLAYDAENRVLSATNGGASGSYTYDGNNLRVSKSSGGTTTVYIFSGSKVIAEYDNGAAVGSPSREYIYSGGALLAKIDSSGTKYYHQDHFSNRLVTDSSGNTLAQTGHYPFGESWYNASGDKLIFTSYERDSESGNDYAMARSYINGLARFSSPDPMSGSLGDPQSLNRYTYTANDPINQADPVGLTPKYSQPAPSPNDYWNYSAWLFDLFILGSDPNSDLSITSGETWNGEEWVEQDDPGAIFGASVFPPDVTGDPGPLVGPLKPPPLPPYCQKDVIQAMKNAWSQSGNGTSGTEGGFNLNGNELNYRIQTNSFTNERGRQTVTIQVGGPNATFANFHVHPNSSGPFPSTPQNAPNGRGDTFVADKYGIGMFVISSRGLSLYDPATKVSQMLRQGMDWGKPCL